MPRRKRQLLDDDDSDSSGTSDIGKFNFGSESVDALEERALFENPYQHKKRRRNGRDDSSEDEGTGGNGTKDRRNDWTKAPSFVSGESVHLTKSISVNENSEEEDQNEVDEDGEDVSIASESSRPPSPPLEDEEDDNEIPGRGGIGSRAMPRLDSPPSAPSPSPAAPESLPSTFSAARAQRSFLRDTASSIRAPQPAPLTPTERAHFGKLQGTFGARMLAKMGWQTGTGLGVTGEGIVTPIDQKQRPGKIGIAYRGFKEKTEQSKAEARRRGEVVSGDEDANKPKGSRSKTGVDTFQRSDAWKKPKKVKAKVEYKTYEQIVAEAGQVPALPGIGKIIDATGATVSLCSISCPSRSV
jgi:tuftelin-interacting protein 11